MEWINGKNLVCMIWHAVYDPIRCYCSGHPSAIFTSKVIPYIKSFERKTMQLPEHGQLARSHLYRFYQGRFAHPKYSVTVV
jgi:hypothetical protein